MDGVGGASIAHQDIPPLPGKRTRKPRHGGTRAGVPPKEPLPAPAPPVQSSLWELENRIWPLLPHGCKLTPVFTANNLGDPVRKLTSILGPENSSKSLMYKSVRTLHADMQLRRDANSRIRVRGTQCDPRRRRKTPGELQGVVADDEGRARNAGIKVGYEFVRLEVRKVGHSWCDVGLEDLHSLVEQDGELRVHLKNPSPWLGAWDTHVEGFRRMGLNLSKGCEHELLNAAPPGHIFGANVYYGHHDMQAFKNPLNSFEIVDHPLYRYGARSMISFHFDEPVHRLSGFKGQPIGPPTASWPLYSLTDPAHTELLLDRQGTALFLRRLGSHAVPEDTSNENKWSVPGITLRILLNFLDNESNLSRRVWTVAELFPKKVLQVEAALAIALTRLFKATEHRGAKYVLQIAPTRLDGPQNAIGNSIGMSGLQGSDSDCEMEVEPPPKVASDPVESCLGAAASIMMVTDSDEEPLSHLMSEPADGGSGRCAHHAGPSYTRSAAFQVHLNESQPHAFDDSCAVSKPRHAANGLTAVPAEERALHTPSVCSHAQPLQHTVLGGLRTSGKCDPDTGSFAAVVDEPMLGVPSAVQYVQASQHHALNEIRSGQHVQVSQSVIVSQSSAESVVDAHSAGLPSHPSHVHGLDGSDERGKPRHSGTCLVPITPSSPSPQRQATQLHCLGDVRCGGGAIDVTETESARPQLKRSRPLSDVPSRSRLKRSPPFRDGSSDCVSLQAAQRHGSRQSQGGSKSHDAICVQGAGKRSAVAAAFEAAESAQPRVGVPPEGVRRSLRLLLKAQREEETNDESRESSVTAKAGSVGASLVSRIEERAARYAMQPQQKTKRLAIGSVATTTASTESAVQQQDEKKRQARLYLSNLQAAQQAHQSRTDHAADSNVADANLAAAEVGRTRFQRLRKSAEFAKDAS